MIRTVVHGLNLLKDRLVVPSRVYRGHQICYLDEMVEEWAAVREAYGQRCCDPDHGGRREDRS